MPDGKEFLYFAIQEAKLSVEQVAKYNKPETRADISQIEKDLDSIKQSIEEDQFEKIPMVAVMAIKELAKWAKQTIDANTKRLVSNEFITRTHNKRVNAKRAMARSFLVYKAIETYQNGFKMWHSELAVALLRDHANGKFSEIAGIKVGKALLLEDLKAQMKYFGFGNFIKTGAPKKY